MKQLICVFISIYITSNVYAQDHIEYSYDAAGNRVKRYEINLGRSTTFEHTLGSSSYKVFPNPVQQELAIEVDEDFLEKTNRKLSSIVYRA